VCPTPRLRSGRSGVQCDALTAWPDFPQGCLLLSPAAAPCGLAAAEGFHGTGPDELGKRDPARARGLGQLVTLMRQKTESDQRSALPGLGSRPRRSWLCCDGAAHLSLPSSIVLSSLLEFDHGSTCRGITAYGVSPRLYRRVVRPSALYYSPSWHEHPRASIPAFRRACRSQVSNQGACDGPS
jgi:hypothetical protein